MVVCQAIEWFNSTNQMDWNLSRKTLFKYWGPEVCWIYRRRKSCALGLYQNLEPHDTKKIDLVSPVEVGPNSGITQFQSNTCRNCKLSRRRVTYFLYRGFPRRPIAVTRSCESRSASSWSFSRSSSILCSRGCQRSSSNLRRRRSHRCTSHFFRQPFNTLRWPCILVLMCFLPWNGNGCRMHAWSKLKSDSKTMKNSFQESYLQQPTSHMLGGVM